MKMFLQEAFYIFLCLFAASTVAAPSSNRNSSFNHLPSLRLSREEVQAIKEGQTHPPGYIHNYITLGGRSVPVVEADPDILLDDDDGHRARARSLPSACSSIGNGPGNCNINYCWTDWEGKIYTETITIVGSNGKTNPTSVFSSNPTHLQLDATLNNGYNGWFHIGEECSNSNTVIYTDVFYDDTLGFSVALTHLQCNTCFFGTLVCFEEELTKNIAAYTNGNSSAYVNCVLE